MTVPVHAPRATIAVTHRDARSLLRLAPLCVAVVGVVWTAAIGFRLGWWRTGELDLGWDALLRATTVPALLGAARVLAVVGTGVPAILSVTALAVAVGWRRGRFWGVAVIVIASLDSLEVTAIKVVAGRLRPDAAFGFATSFPSGHTALAAVLATLAGLLLLRGRRRLMLGAYPVLMGWSRTALHAHWLSDVLAGAAVGAATTALLLGVAAALQRRSGTRDDRGQRPGRGGRASAPRQGRPVRSRRAEGAT